MGKALIIVESPAKIKTLKKFLGPGYMLESSIGHIRDLPQKEFGIDVQNNFEPKYVTMSDKEKVIANLRKCAKECDLVCLSTDPDREGEAIAWHIASILPPGTKIVRATFNSITKDAVLEALRTPRQIDYALVNAQQARRLLDRIVGYKISPILSRRVQRSTGPLSAGRVQSVALKLVVDREKEIEAFKPVEYWNLSAMLQAEDGHKRSFEAYLYGVEGRRVEKEAVEGKDYFLIPNQEVAENLVARMRDGKYRVGSVERKEKKRNPVPPFITSTLQQEASRHYGLSSARTMSIAQSLYEGVSLGADGHEGLITYMRTDSVRISPEALQEARQYIGDKYGKEYLPPQARQFATKGSAQDAHEAVRPTSVLRTPESVQKHLTVEQFKLYVLIWRRFVSSQMNPAIYDTVCANIYTDNQLYLRATGSILRFPGFLAVYEEKKDDEKVPEEEDLRLLPPLQEGQNLDLLDVLSEQAFTRAPARFTEALLVIELEKSGIGRPSTYASIMNKIQSRDYTLKENNRLKPTELGRIISNLLEENFKQIMDVNFTAAMEDNLELVAENKKDWKELLKAFWQDFIPTVQAAEKTAHVPKVTTDLDCPQCQAKLQKIWAGSKYFYGCERYPDCDYKVSIEEKAFDKAQYTTDFDWEQTCPICKEKMTVRHGRFGAFLGCARYPDCRGIINIPKLGQVAEAPPVAVADCPAIGCGGKMMSRRSRFGKVFYSCSSFPNCDVIVNKVEDLAVKYANHTRTPYEKKKGAKAGGKTTTAKATAKKETTKKSTTKPKKSTATTEKKTRAGTKLDLPVAFHPVVGTEPLSRPELVKKIWEYIKEKNLQDPQDKRMIVPDAALSQVLGSTEAINMFQMTAVVSKALKSEQKEEE